MFCVAGWKLSSKRTFNYVLKTVPIGYVLLFIVEFLAMLEVFPSLDSASNFSLGVDMDNCCADTHTLLKLWLLIWLHESTRCLWNILLPGYFSCNTSCIVLVRKR